VSSGRRIALTTLGPDAGKRAQGETAWAALIEALRRAEHGGYDPAALLAAVSGERELRTARSISEVLAWRISRHLAAHPEAGSAQPAAGAAPVERLLPWLAGRRTTPRTSEGITQYLRDASDLITARVGELAAAAVRQRPPWMLPLGLPLDDPDAERQWLRHVAIIARPAAGYSAVAEPGHAHGVVSLLVAGSGCGGAAGLAACNTNRRRRRRPGGNAVLLCADADDVATDLASGAPPVPRAGPGGRCHSKSPVTGCRNRPGHADLARAVISAA
jgi:hypothetical protein